MQLGAVVIEHYVLERHQLLHLYIPPRKPNIEPEPLEPSEVVSDVIQSHW